MTLRSRIRSEAVRQTRSFCSYIYIVTPVGSEEDAYRKKLKALFKGTNMKPILIPGVKVTGNHSDLTVHFVPKPSAEQGGEQ